MSQTKNIIFDGLTVDGISKDITLKKISIKGNKLRITRSRNNDINILQHLLPKINLHQKRQIVSKLRHIKHNYKNIAKNKKSAQDFIFVLKLSLQRLQSMISIAWLAKLQEFELDHQLVEFIDFKSNTKSNIQIKSIKLKVQNISNLKEKPILNLLLN